MLQSGEVAMASRVAVLIGERDEKLGKTVVPDVAMVIEHNGDLFVRTTEGIRLSKIGTGVGAVFRLTDAYVRPRLERF